VGEDLKEWYFVFEGLEKGVDAQLICEHEPLLPGCVGGNGSTSRDSLLHCFLSSAIITVEVICGVGCQS
jgi:hypothetical protein